MPWKTARSFTVVALSVIALAACGSVNIQAPTGVDRGIYNGAGADGGAGQG